MNPSGGTHPLLVLHELRSGYGEAVVLDGVSLSLEAGKLIAILGRNGVGKSTLITSIIGLTKRFGGTIKFEGRSLDLRCASHTYAEIGIAWVPQERSVFRSLTVDENLTATARKGTWTLRRVYDLFPRLEERKSNFGNQLSGGEQQMLAIGRALMLNPKIMLLDEPFEGLAPVIVDELSGVIRRLRDQEGMSIVLVEQHVEGALRLADDVLILERGIVRYRGTASALLADRELLESLVLMRTLDTGQG